MTKKASKKREKKERKKTQETHTDFETHIVTENP